jgi:hypothetical protein
MGKIATRLAIWSITPAIIAQVAAAAAWRVTLLCGIAASSVAAPCGMPELGPVHSGDIEGLLRLLFDPCNLRTKPAQLPHRQDSHERRSG